MIILSIILTIIGSGNIYSQAGGQSASAKTKHDISAFKACDIVKVEEVASITGGKLLAKPSSTSPACMYVIEKNGDTFSYNLIFESSDMVEALLKVQSKEEKGEKIEGKWDEAYLQNDLTGKGFNFLAVWHSDFAMEVSGDDKAAVLEIAKLAASRIK
jgi:hypothetical protein